MNCNQQTALPSGSNKEGTTSDNSHENDICCHHHGVYCPECRKSVCLCTVKDHIAYKNDSAAKRDEIDKVIDVVAASIFCFSLLPLLLTINCLTSLTCADVSQFSDSLCFNDNGNSGIEVVMLTSSVSLNYIVITRCTNTLIILDKKAIKHYKINCATVPDVAIPRDEKIKLNDNYPEGTGIVIAIVCVTLILITALLFCVTCERNHTQATKVSVANLLNEKSSSSKQLEHCFECKTLSSKVDIIPGKAGYLTSNTFT